MTGAREEPAIHHNGTDTELKYKSNGVLREEIAYAVGGDPSRYGQGSYRHFNKPELRRIATTLQPPDSDLTVEEMDLSALYDHVCRWAGADYTPNAGIQAGMQRSSLKAIHREVGGRPPKELMTP